jgi:alpha-mannosidase
MTTVKELLVLHHTHIDIGYTHPQPVVWELHKRYLDEAIELCEHTSGWPESCRLKWTCEVTGAFLHWLEAAPPTQVRRLEALVRHGQISFGAMWCHWMLPLPKDLMVESLRPVRQIRERFGAPVSVAIQHDVNGVPWAAVDILNDMGIPHLLMGINIHMGGYALRRPMAFRWAGPSGRSLLVFSGEHYNAFSRAAGLREPDLEGMERGLRQHLGRLVEKGWPHDFAFLTATHPFMDDNGPPNPALSGLIRRWNEEGRFPFIRLVTPEQLFERVRALPEAALPVHRGDWTDYWACGCGSLALETLMLRRAHGAWSSARALAQAAPGIALNPATERDALRHLFIAYEHTAGAFCSTAAFGPSRQMEPLPVAEQWHHKAASCASALSYARLLRRDLLDAAAKNPVQARRCESLLTFNPSESPRRVCLRVPKEILTGHYPLLAGTKHRLDVVEDLLGEAAAEWIGPLDLPPLGLNVRPLSELPRATVAEGVLAGEGILESPHFSLAFNPGTGRVASLRHRHSSRECVDGIAEWEFFGPVRETVARRSDKSRACDDPRYDLFHITEEAYQPVHDDVDCWNRAWPAHHQGPEKTLRVETRVDAEGAHLLRAYRLAGIHGELTQSITLLAHEPRVRCSAYFNKADVMDPESLYFTFPFRMPQAQMYFESGTQAVAFDRDQLPGACRDWVAAESWVAVAGAEGCLVLACPDAPLFQVGGFNYGRGIKNAGGLDQAFLLAWPMNNYWNTNFRASQPGFIRLRYELTWLNQFDPAECARFGASCARPVLFHPVAGAEKPLL